MGYEVSVEVSKCIEEVSELILFIFSSYFPILCRYGIEGVSGYRSIGYVSGYGYGRSVKYPCNLGGFFFNGTLAELMCLRSDASAAGVVLMSMAIRAGCISMF